MWRWKFLTLLCVLQCSCAPDAVTPWIDLDPGTEPRSPNSPDSEDEVSCGASSNCGVAEPNEEREMREEFESFLADRRSCATAADCVAIYPGCPLGCYAVVATGHAAQASRFSSELIAEHGVQCIYSCLPTPDIACVAATCTFCGDGPNQDACPSAEDEPPPPVPQDDDAGMPDDMTTEDVDGGTAFPADWVEYDSGCEFTFVAPPGLTSVAVQPIDSCVAQYTSDTCRLFIDYGWYSGMFDHPGMPVTIDGYAGEVTTFVADSVEAGPYVAGLFIPSIGESELSPTRLSFAIQCTSAEVRDAMLRVFESIDFQQ